MLGRLLRFARTARYLCYRERECKHEHKFSNPVAL